MAAWLAKGSPPRELVKRRVADTAALLGTLTHVDTREPVVALTFDDGPDPEATPRLLDILAEAGAQATFFMVGKAARRYPRVASRVAREGHAVGNHTWDHSSFPLLTSSWRRLQLRWCQEVLPEGSVKLFRPPWGHQSLGSRLDAWRLGFEVVTWNLMAEDWRDDSAEVLLERVASKLLPGSIVVFHDALYFTDADSHRDRRATLGAVEGLLARLSDRYRFVTVPELMKLGRPRRWHWYMRSDLDWLHKQI